MRPCRRRAVAGVQVAVEQAVAQAALEGGEQQRLHQFGAVETLLADGGKVVDAHAVDVLHGEHPLTGELPMHLRHCDIAAGEPCRPDPGLHRLRLDAEVEFLGEVVGEVGDDVPRREPPSDGEPTT